MTGGWMVDVRPRWKVRQAAEFSRARRRRRLGRMVRIVLAVSSVLVALWVLVLLGLAKEMR